MTDALKYMSRATGQIKDKLLRKDTNPKGQLKLLQEENSEALKAENIFAQNMNFLQEMNVM